MEIIAFYEVAREIAPFAATGIASWIARQNGIIKRRQKYSHFQIKAMDYALERESTNGYRDIRDEELDRLMKQNKFEEGK